MKTIKVTLRLRAEDVAFINKLAAMLDRDRSFLIRKAVADFVAIHKGRSRTSSGRLPTPTGANS